MKVLKNELQSAQDQWIINQDAFSDARNDHSLCLEINGGYREGNAKLEALVDRLRSDILDRDARVKVLTRRLCERDAKVEQILIKIEKSEQRIIDAWSTSPGDQEE